ncbi:hypothetical protein BBJ28_00000378 [Nothophytophthora sp. Chile5]|nr:hypothetical protein BBJ28_00000378 [Nothophytophthora sp. Chile5]
MELEVVICSTSGKPVFHYERSSSSSSADDDAKSSFVSSLQGLLSFVACMQHEELQELQAAGCRCVFRRADNLTLAAIVRRDTGNPANPAEVPDIAPECLHQLLQLLHAQILFVLSDRGLDVLRKQPGYDLRELLSGTERVMCSLTDLWATSPTLRLPDLGVPFLRLAPERRREITRALEYEAASTAETGTTSTSTSTMICGLLLANEQVVAVAQPNKKQFSVLVDGEAQSPEQFPHFQAKKAFVTQRLMELGAMAAIQTSVQRRALWRPHGDLPLLHHFIYKNELTGECATPELAFPFDDGDFETRLLLLNQYAKLQHLMFPVPAESQHRESQVLGKRLSSLQEATAARMVYERSATGLFVGLCSADYRLYAWFDSLAAVTEAREQMQLLLDRLRRDEELMSVALFLSGSGFPSKIAKPQTKGHQRRVDMKISLLSTLLLPRLLLPSTLAAAVAQSPALAISFPKQHSWYQISSRDGLLPRLPVYFQTRGFQIPQDGYLLVTGDSLPDGGARHATNANALVLSGIDPGTHIWTLELVPWGSSGADDGRNSRVSAVATATLHVEIVVALWDVRSPWYYAVKELERKPTVLVNLPKLRSRTLSNDSDDTEEATRLDKSLPVCYVTSVSRGFDGQKRMWLQIMEGLGSASRNDSVPLQFAVKTFENVVADAPFPQALRQLNVSLHGLRLTLSDHEASPIGVIETLLASFYRQFPWAKHSPGRVSKLERAALSQIQPPYAARIWAEQVETLRSPCAHGLVIFSNSRSLADEMLILSARLAGARAVVMELANLHPTPVQVDVLLAPSHFAREHYSVATNVHTRHTFVMSTGVEIQQFKPPAAPLRDEEGFVIGYVGRLSSEKSLGIVLTAMKLLQTSCPRCRLRVIGDGPQKQLLQSLAFGWGLLPTAVEFVAGIYNNEAELVRELQEMHVFASPMFTETLGLAVLEAMSVGLPIVGFISGGTGEFLEDDVNCVAVKKPTALGFADALLLLANDPEKRLRLGRAARRTVETRFSTHKALEQYKTLYERFGRPSQAQTGRDKAAFRSECDGI